jgi:predicted nucleotidyltransferase component of viral defense system
MIKEESYSLEWIRQVSKDHGKADPILVEKVIRALSLLAQLRQSGLGFIFKGGTSLMLLLKEPKRLSIDIDIILSDRTADLNTLFAAVIAQGIFTRYVEQERKVEGTIEKAHYKFFYNPSHRTGKAEEAILLDILFEQNPYPGIQELPIASPFLQCSGEPINVWVPTPESILGDKLTAFAPNTTGITYFKRENSMSMEIMKQLFDIANLFEVAEDLEEMQASFTHIAKA